MKKPNAPHGRGPQILKLLIEHGPLSVRGLSQILEPKIKRLRLQEVLRTLAAKKFVVKKLDRKFGSSAIYYEVNQNPKLWSDISILTECCPTTIYQTQFRPVEYTHSEASAVWAEKLKRILPDATIIREYAIAQSELAKSVLLTLGDDKETLPDILLTAPTNHPERHLAIAVEIERFYKSSSRLIHKLKKYASGSHLDGVIYICDGEAIAQRVQRIFNSKICKYANRINNYGHHFMIFLNQTDLPETNPISAYNASGNCIDLSCWLQKLRDTDLFTRYDRDFTFQSSGSES